jgi:Domain of unknown function (DUF4226)
VAPKHFDQLTHWASWDEAKNNGIEGWSAPGWALPGDSTRYISPGDGYWNHVLDEARAVYGDPNIRYNTDDHSADRYLVFGDGTRLPTDGTVVYHNAGTHQNWIQNDDGTVSSQNPDGGAGPPIRVLGYRPTLDGKFAPIDGRGNQIAPLAGGMPASGNGFYADPKTGLLTPKNANGDYYSLDPNTGGVTFYDKSGRPISQAQYGAENAPSGPGFPTGQQQSGRAADAVRKLQGELKNRYSKISDAEEKLSEVLLNAHVTTADGQQKLNELQQKIVEAIDNPALSLDTPAGEQAYLKFLRSQVAAIGDIVASGTLSAEDQGKAIAALGSLYAADNGEEPVPGDSGQQTATAPSSEPSSTDPPAPLFDPGLGAVEPMPDPTLSDLGLGDLRAPPGPDPLSSLASMLPAALSAFPPAGGFGSGPLDSLGGLAGAAAPLAGLASLLGDQPRHGDIGDVKDKSGDDRDKTGPGDTKDKGQQGKTDTSSFQPAQQPGPEPPRPAPNGTPGQGAPLAGPAPPTSVQLPDGSTANARTPALAQAVKAYLGGTPVDAAYRQAGIELPPPGTPVGNPVDPPQLSCGFLGMFKDHYVVALSSVKALQDGQVVPLGSVASSPDFLGWIDPSAVGAAAPAG